MLCPFSREWMTRALLSFFISVIRFIHPLVYRMVVFIEYIYMLRD